MMFLLKLILKFEPFSIEQKRKRQHIAKRNGQIEDQLFGGS